MAWKIPENVFETTTTTGTGTISLAGPVSGYSAFDDQLATNDTCPYAIRLLNAGTVMLEVGIGTFTSGSPDTLARTTVLYSTSGGSQITLPSGSKDVIGGIPGFLLQQILDPGLTGILAQTAAGLYERRTVTAGTGIAVTNGSGVSGNPTIDVANSYRVRGYVNFTSGGSPAISQGLDASSVSQTASGVYTVTWSTDLGTNAIAVATVRTTSALFVALGGASWGTQTVARIFDAAGAASDSFSNCNIVRFSTT